MQFPTHCRWLVLPLALAACLAWRAPIAAGEVRLKLECRHAGGIVRLGDIAEVVLADPVRAREIERTELLPAPLSGEERFLEPREIHDLLTLRGVDAAAWQFTGADRVRITRPAALSGNAGAAPKRPSLLKNTRDASRLAEEAIRQLAEEQLGGEVPWAVQATLDAAAVAELTSHPGPWTATSADAIATGPGEFELVHAHDASRRARVAAEISPAPQVLVVTRALPRGAVLGERDVKLVVPEANARLEDTFDQPAAAIGKELLQGVVAGQPLRRTQVRAPLLVKQGAPVTVYSRAPGIQVRLVATARDDGAQGELVTVESRDTKQRYLARVVGVQEVEVMAQAPTAEPSPTPLPAPRRLAARTPRGNR